MEDKLNNPVKIALVAPSNRIIGGQSIQAERLLEAFSDKNDVDFTFIPNNPETIFQNVKILRTIFSSFKYWVELFKNIPRSEIVQIFSSGTTSYLISTLPALIVAKIFGKKAILNYHTGEAEIHLREWKRTAVPTIKHFDQIVVPSQFLVDVFGKFGLIAKSVFNFVDTNSFKFKKRNEIKPTFLSNRNFEHHYQVGDILRAFQIIQDEFPSANLIIAGSGSEDKSLKELAKELNLKNYEFLGKVSNNEMPKLYEKADIYLNSSIVDNMPLSIIEAISAGNLIISYDTGGIPYLIEDGKTGLLVETGDYRQLAEKAINLLKNNELAKLINKNCFAEKGKYEWEKVKKEWLETYLLLK